MPVQKVIRMMSGMRLVTLLALMIGVQAIADDWTFEGVDRIVAISDVHGDYEAMVTTLTNAGVVDAAGAWVAGDDHLVITGDLLDRGPDSRPAMDLVMRLEAEAEAVGGHVHLLLGNHEVMNLVGDLRYVAAEEFAAFEADEDPAERDAWLRWYADRESGDPDDAELRAAFNERYPPGFFGHRQAFRSDGHYGRWLLGQPLVVVVNGTAFAHGGLSPAIAELGLAGVNAGLMGEVRDYVRSLDALTDARLLDPAENFYRHASAVESVSADDSALTTAVETLVRLNESDVHGPESPLWYRGNVGCGVLIENDRLGASLDAIGANRVVIGHTPTMTRQVLSRLGGQVVEIDTGMLNAYYRGSGNALIIEGDSLEVITEAGGASAPVQHPRRVGLRRSGLSAKRLADALSNGDIVSTEELRTGQTSVAVEHEGQQVSALFFKNPRGKGFVPELAAYQLDRFLGLDMVPVTVARTVDGSDGVLQFLPERTMDEAARSQSGRGSSAWCPLPQQWAAMYTFDALIHNPGRPPQFMSYSPDNWQLILTGNGKSFTTSRSRPSYLRTFDLPLGTAWSERLEALDEATIDSLFAETLDKKRRRALLSRRDNLLKDALAGR